MTTSPRQSWRAFLEGTQCCILEPKCVRCFGEDKAADRIEELEESRSRLQRDWQLKGLMLRFALEDLPDGSHLAYSRQALQELAANEVVETAEPIKHEADYE